MQIIKNHLINKNNFKYLILIILYKFILDFMYINFTHKLYEYTGFILDFNLLKNIYSYILLISTYIFLPKGSLVSSFILQIHYILIIIPMFTLYAYMNQTTMFLNMVCFSFIFECILVKIFPSIKIHKIKHSKYIFYSIVVIITVYVYFSMIRANGIPNLTAFDFNKIYNIRGRVVYPFLTNYLVQWQGKIINPFFIAIAVHKKNKKLFFVFLILQTVLYLLTTHKVFLFTPFVIIICMYFYKYRKNIKTDIIKLAIVGIIASYLMHILEISTMIMALVDRVLFIPAKLKFFYFDYVYNHEFLYFSEGIIGKLFEVKYPYDIPFANLIGLVYHNKINEYCNTGYLATGYSNLGFWGMIIYTLVIALILKFFDSIANKLDKSFLIGITILPMIGLNDGDLLTTLLTGGLFLLILLVLLYPYNDNILNKDSCNM